MDNGRPHVYDLHSALGGGVDAEVDRLRFAVFDILRDSDRDLRSVGFSDRVERIRTLLRGATLIHPVNFTPVHGPSDVQRFFESRVQVGEEGVVVHCSDGRVFKIKPKASIDAVVVAYIESPSGIGELLLALMPDEQSSGAPTMQIIGSVDTGFSRAERRDLPTALECCNASPSSTCPAEVACHINGFGPIWLWKSSATNC